MKFFLNKKVISFIITLQESFIAVIPFIIFSAFLSLLNIFIQYFHISFIFSQYVNDFSKTVLSFTSLIAAISIAFFVAKRIKISEIVAIILSLTAFISILTYEHPSYPLILPQGFTVSTIFTPIISTYFLKIFYNKFSLHINITDGNYHIYKFFNYIFVFLIAYISTMFIYMAIDTVMDIAIAKYNPLNSNLPNIIILAIRDFLVQLFWIFGIHGEHMVNALFGKSILNKTMMPNLTYGEFHRLFINIGGAGIGLSLLTALLIETKNNAVKTVTKISIPFVIFNINDIIIFLIIVFNRFLFIPFLFLPLLNLVLSYIFLHIIHINFTSYYVVWSTPVFIDGFLKTDSFIIPIFQLVLVVIDTFVYMFFLKKYFNLQSFENKKQILQNNLEIREEIRAKKDIKAFLANQELIEANTKLNEIINNLNQNNLMIYYQPKVDIKNNKTDKFEALLRYSDNGKIKGPFFLDTIEKAGLAPIIDIWVCKQVKKDIHSFKQYNSNPKISINLHPDTLKSHDAITKILDILKNENIAFEIIERSFINQNATENIKRIKNKGYELSIDDYGVGYSSLETLIKQEIDELKLDKSLIDKIETRKGFLICKNTINLCKELKITIVAEGVETKSQLKIIKNLDVDLVQGYVFSPAIPLNKAIDFSKNFSLNDF